MEALKLLPRDEFSPGLGEGVFVPLTVSEFSEAYDAFGSTVADDLSPDPDFPTMYQDGRTGNATPLEDTPFNRAWYAAGKLFDDPVRRVSFYNRASTVMLIPLGKKKRQVRDSKRAPAYRAAGNGRIGAL